MTWFLSFILAGTSIVSSPFALSPHSGSGLTLDQNASVYGDETEISEQTYPISPKGKISVSNVNGSIDIKGWDRPEVKLISKKVASSKERLSDIEIRVTSGDNYLNVEVDYKRWEGKWVKGDNLYVNFSLMVPNTAFLDDIESVNGSIDISGVRNVTSATAVNGAVRASDLEGSVKLSTVNGSLIAIFDRVPANSRISLGTVNGTAEIRLPSNVDAVIKADSLNGSITNGFGLPIRKGEYVGRDLYGQIGQGSSRIRMNSVNGGLKITRLEDGLRTNTVKDLLPSKTSDDFDDSFNGQIRATVESAKIAVADAERAVRLNPSIVGESEKEILRNAAAIAAESARISTEAVTSVISAGELARIDEQRIAAELARVRANVFGNRIAPHIIEDSKTVKTGDVPKLLVDADGANVIVKGWEQQEIKFTVSRIAVGRLSPVERIDFTENNGSYELRVKLVPGAASDELLEQVRVEVFVPRKSNLKVITDREIRVQGVTGELKLTGKTEPINVRDSGGNLILNSKSAIVRVIGFNGTVDAESLKGDLYLEGKFEKISSKIGKGEVYLTVGKETSATILTDNIHIDGDVSENGESSTIDGLRLAKTGEGIWKVGEGAAKYKFEFTSGKLHLRSLKSISAE